MSIVQGTMKKYRIKAQHKHLFKNLGTGEIFFQKEAFLDQSIPQGKAYQAGETPEAHEAVLKKLVEAGFVDVLEESISYVEKGD